MPSCRSTKAGPSARVTWLDKAPANMGVSTKTQQEVRRQAPFRLHLELLPTGSVKGEQRFLVVV